jgi:hypothetical protein
MNQGTKGKSYHGKVAHTLIRAGMAGFLKIMTARKLFALLECRVYRNCPHLISQSETEIVSLIPGANGLLLFMAIVVSFVKGIISISSLSDNQG